MKNALLEAYRRTTFVVADTPNGRLSLRVGQHCAELEALLAIHGVTTWAYVTAFNPGSLPLSAEENAGRQRRLVSSVARLGLASYPGEGVGDDGRWPPEPSLLILGITREAAGKLGSEFGQLAVVYGEKGQEAELLVCTEDSPE
jgi:hypothetical protein